MSIPSAIRQQCWLKCNGEVYNAKCNIIWCRNKINVYSFHCAHNKPRSDGGGIELSNLRTTCSQCNLSMGDKYTIDEWNKLGGHKISCFPSFCFKTERPIIEKDKKKLRSTNKTSKNEEMRI